MPFLSSKNGQATSNQHQRQMVVCASTFLHPYAKGHSILLSSYFYSFYIYLRLYPICNLSSLHLLLYFAFILQMIQMLVTKQVNNEMTYLLGTLDYSVPMPWIVQGACKSILSSLNLSHRINKYSNTIWIPQKTQIQRIKSHTFDLDVPRSILINVDNSKVIMDLVNIMIFRPMTLPYNQALRW